MDKEISERLEEKIEQVEKLGHGEVVVKIKNGVIYRILTVEDELVAH